MEAPDVFEQMLNAVGPQRWLCTELRPYLERGNGKERTYAEARGSHVPPAMCSIMDSQMAGRRAWKYWKGIKWGAECWLKLLSLEELAETEALRKDAQFQGFPEFLADFRAISVGFEMALGLFPCFERCAFPLTLLPWPLEPCSADLHREPR